MGEARCDAAWPWCRVRCIRRNKQDFHQNLHELMWCFHTTLQPLQRMRQSDAVMQERMFPLAPELFKKLVHNQN